MNALNTFNRSPYYWLLMFLTAVSLECVALYYQYVLGDEPCVLCVHIRIWVAGFAVLGLLGALLSQKRFSIPALNGLALILAAGLLHKSWQLLSIERLWNLGGGCEMNAGLPAWFNLEQWLPFLFEVRMPCGATPYVVYEISMAEALVATGGLAVVITVLFFLLSMRPGSFRGE